MMKYIKKPNLPTADVSLLICGTDDKAITDFFENHGITVLKNECNPLIDPPVSAHADMSAIHLGDKMILIDISQQRLSEELEGEGFEVLFTDKPLKGAYPDDIRLNFTVIDDKIIGNIKYSDSMLSDFISKKQAVDVRQGYSKCSTLVINEKAIITDDESIYRGSTKNGLDCLLISKGDISLGGYDYGFIGGASGKISKDTVVFFGNIKIHRDFNLIEEFLLRHGCSYICTDNLPLRDIGGIIPLKENK